MTSIQRGMSYLDGKAGAPGQNPQYNDYVVFCGLLVEQEYPEFKKIISPYKKWIIKHDRAVTKGPYLYFSACHVMALDLIGEHKQARAIFEQLKPFANEGQWKTTFHLGWNLYGCLVGEDDKLASQTYNYIVEHTTAHPHYYQYFTAYCLLKAHEKTQDEKYKLTYLAIMEDLVDFQDQYYKLARADGHAGMAFYDFCMAYEFSKKKKYRRVASELAGILLDKQDSDGSWNTKTAYTIMPVEGLTAYLKYCIARSRYAPLPVRGGAMRKYRNKK